MDDEAPIGEKRRGYRRWSWLVPTLLILPVLTFFLSNLWLATPWARRWIATKIERATGLETHIGSATWSPWNGASLHAVELLQPAALRAAIPKAFARIDGIQIAPVWRAWLRGRLEIRSITLDAPDLTVPLELLSYLSSSQAASAQPPAPATPPPVAQNNPPAANPPAAATPQPPPPPNTVTVPPALPPQPTGWLHLKNASFSIVAIGRSHPLLEIAHTTGSLPIGGDPAQSVLKINSVSFGGKRAFSDLSANIDWKFPALSLKPIELDFQGLKFLVAGKIAPLAGLPIQIEAQIPKQPLAKTMLPFNSDAQAAAIAANVAFRGLLLAPGSWQGDFLAETAEPLFHLSGHEAKFDRGSAVTVLRGGRLSCVDARLIGDELSVLGNATLLANGMAAGVARIVAPPDNVSSIVKQVFPNLQNPSLTPLSTAQRSAFDLEAFGSISQPYLRLGKDGPILSLKNANPPP